ncbi:hypothetical protein [Streptomyces sparsogenes]|uniref:hypothetical protein n=1 Tax=Streptomyces sparsogenes TaxID=67365 RepID=UPI0033CFE3F3
MTMQIDGEDWEISPSVWEIFDYWYGDKSYRQANFVEQIEAAVRAQVAADLEAHARSKTSGHAHMGIVLTHARAAQIAREGWPRGESE